MDMTETSTRPARDAWDSGASTQADVAVARQSEPRIPTAPEMNSTAGEARIAANKEIYAPAGASVDSPTFIRWIPLVAPRLAAVTVLDTYFIVWALAVPH